MTRVTYTRHAFFVLTQKMINFKLMIVRLHEDDIKRQAQSHYATGLVDNRALARCFHIFLYRIAREPVQHGFCLLLRDVLDHLIRQQATPCREQDVTYIETALERCLSHLDLFDSRLVRQE